MSVIADTGASGFVGRHLVAHLRASEHRCVPIVRAALADPDARICRDIADPAEVAGLFEGVEIVIHCAARAHVMAETDGDPLAAYRRVNVAGTRALADEAVRAGVRRFVFLSSIKVNGESTSGRAPYRADDPPAPEDPYGISKHEAEQALFAISAAHPQIEAVVVRAPLVHGAGVAGNMRTMIAWVAKRRPLPLGRATANRRSLIGVANLVDLLERAATHPRAGGRVFLASDGDDVSTAGLLRAIGDAIGTPPRLVPVPRALLRMALAALGKGAIADRLFGDLVVDIDATRRVLDWTPHDTLAAGLRRALTP